MKSIIKEELVEKKEVASTPADRKQLVEKLAFAHGSHNDHDNHQSHRSQNLLLLFCAILRLTIRSINGEVLPKRKTV